MTHLDAEIIGGVLVILGAVLRLEHRLTALETVMKIVVKKLKLD